MNKWLRMGTVVLSLATACLAQEGLTIHSKEKQKWPAAEAEKFTFRHAQQFNGNSAAIVRSGRKWQ
jgi:hypothetical protein